MQAKNAPTGKQVRCVGHDNFDILWVAQSTANETPMQSVIVPPELDGISDNEIIQRYMVRHDRIVPKGSSPETVAVISDYGVNCGIATYTKFLCDAMKPLVSELRILAEDVPNKSKDESHVIRCWNRRDTDFSRLTAEVEKFNPDLIIIQHEFGLFHKLNAWNTLMSQLSRWRTVVTFHTVLEHDVPSEPARLDYLTRSLAEVACREIIVHTPRARQTLRARGFSGRVHFIPHGCFPPERIPKLPSKKYGMYPEQSIFQYGFGGTHKGWEFAINTVEQLVTTFPDVMYLGVFNVTQDLESTVYFRSLLDLIKRKRLEKNVAIHRGYQSEQMLKTLIRCSTVSFFPYQVPNKNWASWGASGAIQLPLSLGSPMILTDYPAFQEFRGRLPIVTTPEEAAREIEKIFRDKDYEKKLSEMSFSIANERRWDKVAQWYLSVQQNADFNAPIGVKQ
jgi:hypothetical protein